MKNKKYLIILFLGLLMVFSLIYAESQGQNLFKSLLDLLLKNVTSTNRNFSSPQPSFINPAPTVFDLESAVTKIAEKSSSAVVSIVISKYVPIVERFFFNPF